MTRFMFMFLFCREIKIFSFRKGTKQFSPEFFQIGALYFQQNSKALLDINSI